MSRIKHIVACLFLAGLCVYPASSDAFPLSLQTQEEIMTWYESAVVKIERYQIGETKKDWHGSGVFYTPTRIVTNSHVIGELPQSSSSFRAVYSDSDIARAYFWIVMKGKKYAARFVGRDPTTDLAVLEVREPIPGAAVGILGDSSNVRVGEEVYAFGNPFGMEHTVTSGIVTAKEKVHGLLSYEDYIQTQAPINPGNSGGPLVSKKDGRIVGIINSGIRGADGMGYAIPINLFKDIEPGLLGTIRRSWIGIQFPKSDELKDAEGFQGLQIINDFTGINDIVLLGKIREEVFDKGGVLVVDVLRAMESVQIDPQSDPGTLVDVSNLKTPAYKTAIRIGDILKKFGDDSVRDSQTLIRAIFKSVPYKETTVTLVRFEESGERKEHTFSITPIIRIPESVRDGSY
ncbi:MAG: peptidase S1C, Do [Parcubacteria group bacterium Gr01-1014_29]|nr:MAG: peptidase S1C, Do [Parcubacteria group bacterium Gr01-1014_29]